MATRNKKLEQGPSTELENGAPANEAPEAGVPADGGNTGGAVEQGEQLPPPPEEIVLPRPVVEILTLALPALPDGKKRPDVSADIADNILSLTFGDGRTIKLDAAQLDAQLRNTAILHGLKQKLVDAAAIPRDTTTGRSPSLNDKWDAVKEVVDRITGPAPAWNKIRDGGVSSANELLTRALMEMSGKPREVVSAMVEKATKDELAALRKHPSVAAILLRMQTENAGQGIDSTAILGKFMA